MERRRPPCRSCPWCCDRVFIAASTGCSCVNIRLGAPYMQSPLPSNEAQQCPLREVASYQPLAVSRTTPRCSATTAILDGTAQWLLNTAQATPRLVTYKPKQLRSTAMAISSAERLRTLCLPSSTKSSTTTSACDGAKCGSTHQTCVTSSTWSGIPPFTVRITTLTCRPWPSV